MVNLETILSWFQTGDYPTQEEFEQTFSSFRHKDTKIPITEVDGLESSINSKLSVDDLPYNMALVDEGQPSDVFNKEQIMAMAMMLSDYVKDGKIRADKIEALGLTDLIESNERNIAEFAANSGKYEFQQNDFIAVPDDKGNFSLFIFKGEEKNDTKNYLPTGLTNITMSMVEGLQSALNTKLDKPAVNGNYFVKMNGTASYQSINPGSDHLLFWNGSEFKNSNIFRESSGLKYGIGTTTPAEQLHLTSRARMSGLVLENNTETLPQQLTYNSKKFFGTDDAGVKRPLMFADNADFLSLANSLTDTQKTAWKTAMNGGWTTNTMSVAVITPPVADNQDKNYWFSLKGANLNLNPANFKIELMSEDGLRIIATIPNSQVQLYTQGTDLMFYYNFKDIPMGVYRLRLWNGLASYMTGSVTNITVVSDLFPIALGGLTWETLQKTPGVADVIIASGNSVSMRGIPANASVSNTSEIVSAAKSSQFIGDYTNFYIKGTFSLYTGRFTIAGATIGVGLSNTLALANGNAVFVRGNGDINNANTKFFYAGLSNNAVTVPSTGITASTGIAEFVIMRNGTTAIIIVSTSNGTVVSTQTIPQLAMHFYAYFNNGTAYDSNSYPLVNIALIEGYQF
ncbi:hypothetical protein [Chryseobacterium binzhouense]|uniref:hypothetical protein n=1 Tax=Chryseobacterium binzhouense TaxID=2593646 RepID=UPI00117C5026|nr:hypothetical protein [Chryseobacterium binzhouense]